MDGIGDAIKYLYDKFLLRDVLSFIVPGAIVSIPAAYIINPRIVYYPIPWPFYILIFGVVYMLGFSLQCLGQLMGVIHHYPPDFSPWPWSERRKMLPLKDLKDSYKGRRPIQKYFRRMAPFWEIASGDIGLQQARERLVLLRQMSANGAMSIVYGAVVSATAWFVGLFALLWLIPLVVSLWWGYHVSVYWQWDREQEVIDRFKKSTGRGDS